MKAAFAPYTPTPIVMGAVAPTATHAAPAHYMVQLDALRALAVLAVMFNHFYGAKHNFALPLGDWGVQLFFVLSGFLITGILLRCRDVEKTSPVGNHKQHRLRQFYIRRFLRIFPLFYLVIALAFLANIQPVRETLWWHLGYSSNILIASQNGWIGPLSHFWTLAVEEQFYLIWPFPILFLPSKYLLPSIVAVIIMAPVYRTVGPVFGVNSIAISVLMFGSLDFLGIGALLALFQHLNAPQFGEIAEQKRYCWLGLLLLSALIVSASLAPRFPLALAMGAVLTPLCFVWIIHKAAAGIGGIVGKLLQFRPMIYLGQISYGIYIFHKFITVIVPHGFGVLHIPYPEHPVVEVTMLIAINITLASLSWFILERPISQLKSHFAYAS